MKTTDDQQELFIVVDKDDNVFGYRTRYDCHHDKSLIHRAVGVAIFNRHGELLLQKRSLTKDTDPGLYALSCAGHLTKGDTYESAAKRELMEELGVDLTIEPVGKFDYVSDIEHEIDMLFKATSDGPFTVNREEIDSVIYVSGRELAKKMHSGEIILSACADLSIRKTGFL